ncbi:MAG: carbohydrate kinase, partial [Nocardioidaceae bacterium]|nr:carbohydrate kinase [Nocardioidaceae bacterium]
MFTVIGEALLDMVQDEPRGPFTAKPGGGPLNIAVGLARLGHPTELKARLSTSPLAAVVRDHAANNQVGLTRCVDAQNQTTLAFAALDDEGRATYEFYVQGTADWGWTSDELGELPVGTVAVHTGSLAAVMAPGADVLIELWQRLAGEGELFLSYDPNIRPDLAGPRESAVGRV